MEYLRQFIDLVLHIDQHLDGLIHDFGPWIYALLFLILFCETGLVVTPILPGDSLLFAAGALAASPQPGVSGPLNIIVLTLLLTIAPILGNSLNYTVGHFLGPELKR